MRLTLKAGICWESAAIWAHCSDLPHRFQRGLFAARAAGVLQGEEPTKE